jgi:histidinol-phosphatase (PHP family)
MWSNVHTHSSFCDGKGTLEEFSVAAINAPLLSLGFSSHAPLPFSCSWCMRPESFPSYLKEIESLENMLPIYKGLEVDFIPEVISPKDFRDRLDFTIGSIHFVDSFPDGKHWEIDGPHDSFLAGLTTIFGSDFQAAASRYFELTREMLRSSAPTIVGHLDKIKIQNVGNKFFNESDLWYRAEIVNTLNVLKSSGSILEVNTRGLYQGKSETCYPSPWVLERALEKNIPVTISSDAHHPKDLVNQFHEMAVLLKKTGFKTLCVLYDGTWKNVSFNENGIQP